MSFEKISKLLKGDTPGRSVELHYSRIGTVVFAVLTVLCLYKRVRHNKGDT